MSDAEVEKAHLEYEAFVMDPRHAGFNAESFWMASRGLLARWIKEMGYDYRLIPEPVEDSAEGIQHTSPPPDAANVG